MRGSRNCEELIPILACIRAGDYPPVRAIPVQDQRPICYAVIIVVSNSPDAVARRSSYTQQEIEGVRNIGAADNAPVYTVPVFGQCGAISISYGPDIVARNCCHSFQDVDCSTKNGAGHELPCFAIPVFDQRSRIRHSHSPDIVASNCRDTIESVVARAGIGA